jgi:hypothetical protein
MTPISKTRAQQMWGRASVALDRALGALKALEGVGRAEHAEIEARVQREADALMASQPRDARVSRSELESHARLAVERDVVDRVRERAREGRKQCESALARLKATQTEQRREIRRAVKPRAVVEAHETFSGVPDLRAMRIELGLLNARLEMGSYSLDELLSAAESSEADEPQRYVAESMAARLLAAPVAYPEPDGRLSVEQNLAVLRKAKHGRETAEARLHALQTARVPSESQARELACEQVIALCESRYQQIATPLAVVAEHGVPMPDGFEADAFESAYVAAREALHGAIARETSAELKGGAQPGNAQAAA